MFSSSYGLDVLNSHAEAGELKARIHRFRAVDEMGLRALGKDVVKFAIERLNKKSLVDALKVGKSELGTLKLVESVLTLVTNADFARQHVAPLFGAYELRGADAHLASSDIESAYQKLGIDRTSPYPFQGAALVKNIAETIGVIGTEIQRARASDLQD